MIDLKKWHKTVVQTVQEVELEFGGGNGDKKRELAIRLLNRLINVKGVPEVVEGWILGWLIDLVIHIYDRQFGKGWRKNKLFRWDIVIKKEENK